MLIRWLILTFAILIAAYLLPGVEVTSVVAAIVTALVLGLVNTLLRPIAVILTLPLTILTFGLFLFVINALLIMLVSWIVPGFAVDGFLWAVVLSLILSLLTYVLEQAVREAAQPPARRYW